MARVKKPYGPWSKKMLSVLRERGLLKLEAFAHWLGEQDLAVDRTLVSHWVAGNSHLPADILPHLCAFTGRPDLVFGIFMREVRCDLVNLPEGAPPDKELTDIMLETGATLGRMHEAVVEARAPESPGGEAITYEERELLQTRLDELIQQLSDMRVRLLAKAEKKPRRKLLTDD